MGIGNQKTTNHISGFKSEIDSAAGQKSSVFFNWFNESGGDIELNFIRGKCDFVYYFLLPLLARKLNLKNKTVLEIGYGGGRLLAEAATVFKKAIGIDVHSQKDLVLKELNSRGINNIELIQNNGREIPVQNDSVDVVYSLIVLQHVEKIEIFNNYLNEAYRVLRDGGYAILFYGRLHRRSINTRSRILYFIDRILDRASHKQYKEFAAEVNCTNLIVANKYVRGLCQRLGFEILQEGVSRKIPDTAMYGGQSYIIVRKKPRNLPGMQSESIL
jgi:ubiquinone/menaquinone biosynthesis C-methylase UbiE